MTRRPTSPTTGLKVLKAGQSVARSDSGLDHDSVGSLATGEPQPADGMRWRVLGTRAGSMRGFCGWVFVAHAPNEATARKIGQELSSLEWSRWKHERLGVTADRRLSFGVRRQIPNNERRELLTTIKSHLRAQGKCIDLGIYKLDTAALRKMADKLSKQDVPVSTTAKAGPKPKQTGNKSGKRKQNFANRLKRMQRGKKRRPKQRPPAT